MSPDIFTQFYRGGSVFKDPHARWAITEVGKGLIEQNKLFIPDRCMMGGMRQRLEQAGALPETG